MNFVLVGHWNVKPTCLCPPKNSSKTFLPFLCPFYILLAHRKICTCFICWDIFVYSYIIIMYVVCLTITAVKLFHRYIHTFLNVQQTHIIIKLFYFLRILTRRVLFKRDKVFIPIVFIIWTYLLLSCTNISTLTRFEFIFLFNFELKCTGNPESWKPTRLTPYYFQHKWC